MIDRVLIAGHGSIGKRHLRIARSLLPDADIRVLVHRPVDTTPEFANGVFDSLDAAVSFKPNIAIVAGPASTHVQTALPLARAGAHLLIEKPLDASLEEGVALLQLCDSRRIVLLVGYNLRYVPSLDWFRQALHSGRVGRVLSVRAEVGQYLPSWRPHTDYRNSASASRALGGGVLLELSHEVDYLQWIFGDIVWVKASAGRQSSLELDVEDTAHLIMGFTEHGVWPHLIGTLNMDFFRHDTTRSCVAIGESGSLRWNGLTNTVDFFGAGASEWTALFKSPVGKDDSYVAEWNHFLECIRGKAETGESGADSYRTLQVIEAARRSAAQRDAVWILNRPPT